MNAVTYGDRIAKVSDELFDQVSLTAIDPLITLAGTNRRVLETGFLFFAGVLFLLSVTVANAQEAPPQQPTAAPAPSTTPAAPAVPVPTSGSTVTSDPAPPSSLPRMLPITSPTTEQLAAARAESAWISRQQNAMRVRQMFDDTDRVLNLSRQLAVIPLSTSGPSSEVMKGLQRECREVEKSLMRILNQLKIGKLKTPVSSSEIPASATDVILRLLHNIDQLQPELSRTVQNRFIIDPARNRKLVADLEVVRLLTKRLQQRF